MIFMIGAIIGDIVGSSYEFYPHNIKTTDFPLLKASSKFTDDTVMTCAIAAAIMKVMAKRGDKISEEDLEAEIIKSMHEFGNRYPKAGYGGRFIHWLASKNPKPYGSFGNGSAMRVSPVAWAFDTLEDVEKFAEISARVSHNHPEGIKGAQSVAGAIFLARNGKSHSEIKEYIENKYGYDLNKTLAQIRPDYYHIESCQGSVPESIISYLEASDFESTIRNAVSLGGDADTQAAIAGSIAEGEYEIPHEIIDSCLSRLDDFIRDVVERWQTWLNN